MPLPGCAIAIALSRAADLHGAVLVLTRAIALLCRYPAVLSACPPAVALLKPGPTQAVALLKLGVDALCRPAQARLLTPCVALLSARPWSSRRPAQARPLTSCVILLSAAALKRRHHPALRRRSQASPLPCSPLPCLSSSAGRCLSVAPCCYQVPHADLHLFHYYQIIFPAPISTW